MVIGFLMVEKTKMGGASELMKDIVRVLLVSVREIWKLLVGKSLRRFR